MRSKGRFQPYSVLTLQRSSVATRLYEEIGKFLVYALHLLSSAVTKNLEFAEEMTQIITAKLKLNLDTEQKALLSRTALAYPDALKYASVVAFDNGKISNGALVAKGCLWRCAELSSGLVLRWLAV
jgi:hypothetical protein